MTGQMGIEESKDSELPELQKDVAPEHVLDRIEETHEKFERKEIEP